MPPAYREYRAAEDVNRVVACLWEHPPSGSRTQRVVPDGCVDLIWLAERELVIAGPDTGPRSVHLPANARTSGIRLRAGAAGAVLGVPACALRDTGVPAALIWGEEAEALEAALAEAAPARRLDLLTGAIARRCAEPDAIAVAAASRLAEPGARVATVAAALGVSERQLHRRMLTAVGYGPKLFARVARLRRLVKLGDDSLAARAIAAGYANQAHMSDEVRRLTGTTPVRFLEDAEPTAA
jgi:methylphosphotriester-DNA--protein-cysteine methyltransferase